MQANFNCGELKRLIRSADLEGLGADGDRAREMMRFLNNVPKQQPVLCTPEEIAFLTSLPARDVTDA